MEPLLKRYFPKLYRRISVQKVNYRIIYLFIVALISLISVFGIHKLFVKRAIGSEPAAQLICTKTPNPSPEQLSIQGRESYNNGRFDKAMDCWQKAIAGYRKLDNETETVNNQINLAQAEQALGFFPRACSTLLEIYGEENCKTLPQEENKRKEFREKLAERANSPSKIAGLRSFGNVLRGLGELNLSNEVLLLSRDKSQPQEKAAIWLDLGNTRRALSNKEQDLYYRSQEQQNLICAIIDAYAATEAYEMAEGKKGSTSPSPFNTKLQSQLNQLSLVLDLQDWHNSLNKQTKGKPDVLNQLFSQNRLFLALKTKDCWERLTLGQSSDKSTNEVRKWLLDNQLSKQNPLIQLPQIDKLQQQIEKLPVTHAALFTRLNFAKNLIRIDNDDNVLTTKIKQFLETSIEQAKGLQDSNTESYGYGYLGELYQKRGEFELAKKNTETALFIAQSLELASETQYLWEWQLGRIYFKIPVRTEALTKAVQQESLNNLNAAREMYQRAYLTLQSMRRELVAGNPDAQFSFLNDIETIYRNYVNLLLWDEEPSQEYLFKAREVIASLQAVELENFLRIACPENNVEKIDEIIDEKATKTAFLYPIVLEDRIEVIIKLPETTKLNKEQKNKNNLTNLRHYRTSIKPDIENKVKKLGIDLKEYTLDAFLRKYQLDLEEDYTFEEVRKEGQLMYELLLGGAKEYLQGIDTLVFALDTNLRNIPLAALVVDYQQQKPTYLIEKYAVALAPRLDIPEPISLTGKNLNVLAVGLREADLKNNSNLRFPQLNYVKEELEAIETPMFNFSVSQLRNDKFTIEAFKEKVNKSTFQILHLATHGEFSSSPEKTFLLAYDRPIYVKEVGDVFTTQAQKQPEPIEMLVLSACETAAGDQRATLGISGVAVRAGARSAIASLWTLDDKISTDFTKYFYEQLVSVKQTQIEQMQTTAFRAKALQEAQREIKKIPGREHPRYWAPYILLGNWL